VCAYDRHYIQTTYTLQKGIEVNIDEVCLERSRELNSAVGLDGNEFQTLTKTNNYLRAVLTQREWYRPIACMHDENIQTIDTVAQPGFISERAHSDETFNIL